MHSLHLKGLDLNLLLVVEALVSEPNVTRAAAKLGLSQSALSHALGRARSAFDDPLLVRSGRRMLPTPRAEALASAVRSGLSTIEHSLADGRGFDARNAERTFTLAMSDYAELVLLPPLMARLRKEAPGVNIWVGQVPEPYPQALMAGSVELAITLHRETDQQPGIRHEVIFGDQFVCAMRVGHALARGRLTLDRYCAASHLLIAPRGQRGGQVDDALAALGRHRRVALGLPHFMAAPHLVSTTDLIATLASRLARSFARPLQLVLRAPPVELPTFAMSQVWHQRLDRDPGLTWLRGIVREVCSKLA